MNRRSRRCGQLCVAIAVWSAGCIGSMPPPPPRFQTSGIRTETTPFQKEEITSLAGSRLGWRIMQVAGDEEHGGLLVLAENGLRRIGKDGAIQDIVFGSRMFRHRLVPLADGRQAIGGLSLRPNAALVTDLEGREILRIDLGRGGYDIPQFANVTGDAAVEMILPGRLDARIISLGGDLLGKVSRRTYATIKTVIQADEDPEYEIAFVQRSLREGPIAAMIMNANGSTVSEWRDTEGGWLSFVPELGDRTLWGITSDGFTAWDASGKRVRIFPAADVDYLRYVIGTRFKDHTALIASGGGYSNLSVLCVFDDERRLVFQEVYPSRTYAVFARPGADDFLVGVDDRVVRYSIGRSSGGVSR